MQRAKQFGFTLIEITLAIVIICLVAAIMGIGQNLTMIAKVNRLYHDFHSIQTAIYDSQVRLRQIHGNIHKASSQLADSGSIGNSSNGNAILGENWMSTSGETFNLWQNVQPAGIAQGLTDTNSNSYVPLNTSGSIVGISKVFNAPIAGLKGSYIICTNNIAGSLIKQLDLEMDDGNTASGSMMVANAIGGTGIATDSITDSATYLVCQGV
jgi:prepilin-type N-terminal cleavage/methylation domain-containing protein